MPVRTWTLAPIALLPVTALMALPSCSSQVVDEHAAQGSSGSDGSNAGACKPDDPAVALASGEDSPFALAIDAEFVYFTTSQADMCASNAAVKRVSKHGGVPEIIGKATRP